MRLPFGEAVEGLDFAVIGVPFDTGATFRVGARFGPEAIRSISSLLKPYNPCFDIDPFDHLAGVDCGDLQVVPGFTEESYREIHRGLLQIVQAGVVPILLGGDHSVTLPELRAIKEVHRAVALVHFDAHYDTADHYFGHRYTHGTPFRRAVEEGLVDPNHSIQVGMRGSLYGPEDREASRSLGFDVITGEEVDELGLSQVSTRIRERVGAWPAFVSFDIDVVDPAYAPGTGTMEPGGMTSREALRLVRGLAGLKLIGFDLVEVLPSYDPSNITALLAAGIVSEYIALLALGKKGG